MQDDAQPHVTRVCRQFLDDEGIDAIDWPSLYPDLNPIENLWDFMYWCICHSQVGPQTAQELIVALIQVWEEIPVHFILDSVDFTLLIPLIPFNLLRKNIHSVSTLS